MTSSPTHRVTFDNRPPTEYVLDDQRPHIAKIIDQSNYEFIQIHDVTLHDVASEEYLVIKRSERLAFEFVLVELSVFLNQGFTRLNSLCVCSIELSVTFKYDFRNSAMFTTSERQNIHKPCIII
jgi:hypothetical protein